MPRHSTAGHYIERHGAQHRLRVWCPSRTRPALVEAGLLPANAERIVIVLPTGDPREARNLAAMELLRIRAMIAEAGKPPGQRNTALLDKLAELRRVYKETENPFEIELQALLFAGGTSPTQRPILDALHDAVVEEKFLITEHLDAWLRSASYSLRTEQSHRQIFSELQQFMLSKSIPPLLANVTGRVASDFVQELQKRGLAARTVNKLSSGLRTAWNWFEKHSYTSGNPWKGLHIAQRKVRPRHSAYTFEELQKLVTECRDPLLRAVILSLAGSGLRREELMTLTPKSIIEIDGIKCFNITEAHAKSSASIRAVPLTASVWELVKPNLERARGPNAYLFAAVTAPKDARPATKPRPLGDAIGKRFRTLKDRALGKEHAGRLHDLRRYSAQSMTDALRAGAVGFDHYVIAATLGHEVGPMQITFGVYAHQISIHSKLAALETIKLPA